MKVSLFHLMCLFLNKLLILKMKSRQQYNENQIIFHFFSSNKQKPSLIKLTLKTNMMCFVESIVNL